MKGDFSRQTFDPTRHYSRVLMQQGRVQVDADWNEQQAITGRRIETETLDVIGACGAPVDHAGFEISKSADGKQLLIGAGRYYVDGILCENDTADLDYAKQPDFPQAPSIADVLNPPVKNAPPTPAPPPAAGPNGLVYLDVWHRHITALDDPAIVEKALGGPDTATRVKTVWQVRILPAGKPDCKGDFQEWKDLVADTTGKLSARTVAPPPGSDACLPPPTAGFQRLDNQLYRVEVHQGGTLPGKDVTFKWSRDNGTVVTAVQKMAGNDITVGDLGPDDVLGFAAGQWVEITNDVLELSGRPGVLVQIQDVKTASNVITIQAPAAGTTLPDAAAALHPKLRRWDQSGAGAVAGGVTATGGGTFQALEDGVEVAFADGTYRTGDYWLIPARTATGSIEWPLDGSTPPAPIPQARLGIRHHFCPLATLTFDTAKTAITDLKDCRSLFPPLTRVGENPAVDALHVTDISWPNDRLFDAFFQDPGLEITLDQAADSINPAAIIVAMEASLPVFGNQNFPVDFFPDRGMLNLSYIIRGNARIDAANRKIVWKFASAGDARTVTDFVTTFKTSTRVRVTLKGHLIWHADGNRQLYLDGQAFGKDGAKEGERVPTDLIFPSGAGAKASDFESWFYLLETPGQAAPPPPPPANRLQVKGVNFVFTNQDPAVRPRTRVIASWPTATPNAPVQFTNRPGVNTFEVTFSGPVDAGSLTAAALQAIKVARVPTSGPDPTGDVAVEQAGQNPATAAVLLLSDFKPLDVGAYRLIVSSAVKGADGSTLVTDFVLPFNVTAG